MTAGAILAGGQARRYGGADKSRLVVDGASILDRQIAALRPLCDTIVAIVNDDKRRARFADARISTCVDLIPGTGAIGGIYTALAATGADAVITIACDLPNLPTGLLQQLLERSEGADAAWVVTPRGPEPLVACYRQTARDAIRACIDAGELKAADLARTLRIIELTMVDVEAFGPARHVLANINTPDEYASVVGSHTSQNAPMVSHGIRPPDPRGEAG